MFNRNFKDFYDLKSKGIVKNLLLGLIFVLLLGICIIAVAYSLIYAAAYVAFSIWVFLSPPVEQSPEIVQALEEVQRASTIEGQDGWMQQYKEAANYTGKNDEENINMPKKNDTQTEEPRSQDKTNDGHPYLELLGGIILVSVTMTLILVYF